MTETSNPEPAAARPFSEDLHSAERTAVGDRPRLIRPTPEVILLIDESGHISRQSRGFAGERLGDFDFAPGLTPHDVMHPGCSGSDCRFAADWLQAWQAHKAGLPVEWILVHHASEARYKLRLQAVSYACGVLYGDAIHDFDQCSVLFIQDISNASNVEGAGSAGRDVHVTHASVYQLRRSTDPDPDIVASLDDRLRTITGRLLVSQDAERKRIAAELHDGLGQTLSLLRFELEDSLERTRQSNEQGVAGPLERSCAHAIRALHELRDITRNLRPTVINDLGLRGSLEMLCSDLRVMLPGVELTFDGSGNLNRIPDELVVTLYRIAQEALNNIARHAKASEVMLRVSVTQREVAMSICDNGIGLDTGDAARRGLGLVTMRERAEAAGCTYELSSQPDAGCKLSVRWLASGGRSLG